jgi:hypothetical protein
VPRYGTKSFIGAIRTKTGFEIDSDMIVPIPVLEIRANLSAYAKMLKDTPRRGKALIERTHAEYVEYVKSKATEQEQPAKTPAPASQKKSKSKSSSKKNDEEVITVELNDGGE